MFFVKFCARWQVSETIYSNMPFIYPSCKTGLGTKNHASIYYLTIKEIIDEHYAIDVIFHISIVLSSIMYV